MENRVIQAVLLSLAVLILYQTFLAPRPTPPSETDVTQTSSTTTPQTVPAEGPPAADVAAEPSPASEPDAASAPAPLVAADRDEVIVVTSPNVRAEFSTRVAVLRRWTLTGYHDS